MISCVDKDDYPDSYYSASIPYKSDNPSQKNESDFPNNSFELEEAFINGSKYGYKIYLISFIELKSKEGVLIEVFHNAKSRIIFEGAIVGHGKINFSRVKFSEKPFPYMLWLALFGAFSIFAFYVGTMGLMITNHLLKEPPELLVRILSFCMLVGALVGYFAFSFFFSLRLWEKQLRLIPDNIKEYFRD